MIEPENLDVNIERGAVYYRTAGAATFTSIALKPLGGNFSATIPGTDVTELGLEYYVEVENSGVFSRTPPDAPIHLEFLQVAAPTSIQTFALPNLGNSVTAGLDVAVSVQLPQGAQFVDGTLYYRAGGTSGYASARVIDPSFPRAIIPAAAVGERGLEYWVGVETASGTQLQDPPSSPEINPRTLRVAVANAMEPTRKPGVRYRLIGIPIEFPQEFGTTVLASCE